MNNMASNVYPRVTWNIIHYFLCNKPYASKVYPRGTWKNNSITFYVIDNMTSNVYPKHWNKRQKDYLWKHRTHYRLENGSLGFIETLHKQ